MKRQHFKPVPLCFVIGLAGPLLGSIPHAAAADEEAPESAGRPGGRERPTSEAVREWPLATAPASALSADDLATVRRAIELARKGGVREASDLRDAVTDPVGRKLVEWTILRSDDRTIPLARYRAFIESSPGWPSLSIMRRRAESLLWDDRHDAATVRAFFKGLEPLTARGRFALARALMSDGDREGAARQAREAWRNDALPRDLEAKALEAFGPLLTAADHKARMDQRLYDNDDEGALRAAERLGAAETAIAKARIAVGDNAANAGALLDAVPAESRGDAGYIFSRTQWLRRHKKVKEAAALIQTAPRDPDHLGDVDAWWLERRLLARALLDIKDPKAAHAAVRDALPPTRLAYRAEQQFTAGWIALRFLNDPAAALVHFEKVDDGSRHPATLSRAGYWRGRAHEAMGRAAEAREQYEAAARHATAYYGQLARAKLGIRELTLRPPPDLTPQRRAALSNLEVVRAVEMLYALDQRDLVIPFTATLGELAPDADALAVLAEVAERNADARSLALIGRGALARGLPLDRYAFPTVGFPDYTAIGPQVDAALVYAVARQESGFNPAAVSPAKAMGLMQVTPATAQAVARRHSAPFDEKRLLSDPAFNVQLGAAELGGLLQDHRGSYLLAFASYNAGRGRVKEWLGKYGDPRNPKVDPIDWVERIPFPETRNYVQRVLENVQVYRARLAKDARLTIDADLRRGGKAK